jgi:hypothetical protein
MPDFGLVQMENCLPIGNIQLFAIRPGEIVQREWTFRCNGKVSFLHFLDNTGAPLQGVNAGNIDPRNLSHGTDGSIWLVDTRSNGFTGKLLQAQEWTMSVDVRSQDVQALGIRQIWAVPTSISVSLTIREFVINDNILLAYFQDLLSQYQSIGGATQNNSPNAAATFAPGITTQTFCDPGMTFQGRIEMRNCV